MPICVYRALAALFPMAALSPAWGAGLPIQHVIIIMQENRSFDSYFGTFPGANGLSAGVCVPLDPARPNRGCVQPFHDYNDADAGGPHKPDDATQDLDRGVTQARLDGFVLSQAQAVGPRCERNPLQPKCAALGPGVRAHDVMGFHTDSEIPNYWIYARNFVLQDAMFASARSWSLPEHLYLTSEWTAHCRDPKRALSCDTAPDLNAETPRTEYPWVTLFQLLDMHGVSWKYYLGEGQEPDCEDGGITCDSPAQSPNVPSIWNPAPFFSYIKAQGAPYLAAHVPQLAQFYADLAQGTLPQVAWVVPGDAYSEHPPAGVTAGMEFVTGLVNAVMQSPYWASTAIFLTWDDWGGFYDHVVPPIADLNRTRTPVQGYGLRVPGLMISAYAKQGMIDHAIYSHDSYATFIEDLFLGGARLDPAALGNPDRRPTIRDALRSVRLIDGREVPLGNLMDEFDFTQAPRPPLRLTTAIPTGIAASCDVNRRYVCRDRVITLNWNAVPPQAGQSYTYGVQRDGITLPQCSGVATTCHDVPGRGTHLYRAFSLSQGGVSSPLSAAASAEEP